MLRMLGTGAIMWNEREMPARWYELLRERMQVEQLRMRIVKHGYLIEDDQLQELLTEAHSLDSGNAAGHEANDCRSSGA